MTWEEKLEALQALDPNVSLRMRSPGDWYVSDRLVLTDGVIRSGPTESGVTPDLAVAMHWDQYTKPPNGHVVLIERDGKRRTVRWAKFMWQDVEDPRLPYPAHNKGGGP